MVKMNWLHQNFAVKDGAGGGQGEDSLLEIEPAGGDVGVPPVPPSLLPGLLWLLGKPWVARAGQQLEDLEGLEGADQTRHGA